VKQSRYAVQIKTNDFVKKVKAYLN